MMGGGDDDDEHAKIRGYSRDFLKFKYDEKGNEYLQLGNLRAVWLRVLSKQKKKFTYRTKGESKKWYKFTRLKYEIILERRKDMREIRKKRADEKQKYFLGAFSNHNWYKDKLGKSKSRIFLVYIFCKFRPHCIKRKSSFGFFLLFQQFRLLFFPIYY